jgi:hypothetical protein
MTKFMHEMNLAPRRSGAVVLCSAFLLSMIGLLVLFSISIVQHLKSGQSITSLWATRQAFWLAASAVVCGLCARIDYHILLKHCWKFLGLVWIGLCAALVIGDKQYGSRRWLELGPVNIQCSEVAKLVVILCCGRYVGAGKDRLSSYLTGFARGRVARHHVPLDCRRTRFRHEYFHPRDRYVAPSPRRTEALAHRADGSRHLAGLCVVDVESKRLHPFAFGEPRRRGTRTRPDGVAGDRQRRLGRSRPRRRTGPARLPADDPQRLHLRRRRRTMPDSSSRSASRS